MCTQNGECAWGGQDQLWVPGRPSCVGIPVGTQHIAFTLASLDSHWPSLPPGSSPLAKASPPLLNGPGASGGITLSPFPPSHAQSDGASLGSSKPLDKIHEAERRQVVGEELAERDLGADRLQGMGREGDRERRQAE